MLQPTRPYAAYKLLRGQSGVGKTMLAKNIGLSALLAGKTVRFTTLAAALADLLQQESLPAFERRLKRYTAACGPHSPLM